MAELFPVKLIIGVASILFTIIVLGILLLILYGLFKFLFKKKLLKSK